MKAVILDLESLEDLDLSPIASQFEQLDHWMATAADQVAGRIEGYDVVITNKVRVDAAAMATATELKLICVVATGTNNIDLEAAADRGVKVANCVAYGVDSVVQHVFSMMLALHTNLISYDRAAKAGDWGRASQFCLLSYPIQELAGRTLGIIGFGNLGQGVARIAEAFGMKVLVAQRPGGEPQAGRLPLDQLLPQVDVLSLHCPLTTETRDIIDADAIARMPSGSFIVNAARGGVVSEEALAAALRSGHLAGAATDVLTEEPPRNGNPLLAGDIPNLIVTPHSAWGSRQARERIVAQTAENIADFFQGKDTRQVN